MCDVKITMDTIIGLAALVVAIIAYLHSRNSSKENKKQIAKLDNDLDEFHNTYRTHLEEKRREKEEREKSFVDAFEQNKKLMEKSFKQYYDHFKI